MPKQNGLRGELEKTGALPLLKAGDGVKAAAVFYDWLADNASKPQHSKPGLYEMIEYLATMSAEIGFTLDSRIEAGSLVFTIRKGRIEDGVVVPDFVAALLGRILEQHSRCDAEISNRGDETVVALKLGRST